MNAAIVHIAILMFLIFFVYQKMRFNREVREAISVNLEPEKKEESAEVSMTPKLTDIPSIKDILPQHIYTETGSWLLYRVDDNKTVVEEIDVATGTVRIRSMHDKCIDDLFRDIVEAAVPIEKQMFGREDARAAIELVRERRLMAARMSRQDIIAAHARH